MATEPVGEDPHDEPPPSLGSWRAWYALVLGALVVTIAALTVFSRMYP